MSPPPLTLPIGGRFDSSGTYFPPQARQYSLYAVPQQVCMVASRVLAPLPDNRQTKINSTQKTLNDASVSHLDKTQNLFDFMDDFAKTFHNCSRSICETEANVGCFIFCCCCTPTVTVVDDKIITCNNTLQQKIDQILQSGTKFHSLFLDLKRICTETFKLNDLLDISFNIMNTLVTQNLIRNHKIIFIYILLASQIENEHISADQILTNTQLWESNIASETCEGLPFPPYNINRPLDEGAYTLLEGYLKMFVQSEADQQKKLQYLEKCRRLIQDPIQQSVALLVLALHYSQANNAISLIYLKALLPNHLKMTIEAYKENVETEKNVHARSKESGPKNQLTLRDKLACQEIFENTLKLLDQLEGSFKENSAEVITIKNQKEQLETLQAKFNSIPHNPPF